MKIAAKFLITAAVAILPYAPVRAVEPWLDAQDREKVKPLPPVAVDMEVRADPDGFLSVADTARGIRLSGTSETGSRFKLWGRAGEARLDLAIKKYQTTSADERVEGYLLTAPGIELRLDPPRRRRGS